MVKEIVLYDGSTGALSKNTCSGWSEPEADYMWSCDKVAYFEFSPKVVKVTKPCQVYLKLVVAPYLSNPTLMSQPIAVYCMGSRAVSLSLAKETEVEIPFYFDPKTDGALRFDFDFPGAMSPLEIGDSADPRPLGFRLYSLILEVED